MWGPTVKLVVGLTFVAIFAALLIRFRGIVGPLLLALILAYLLHPVASWLTQVSRLSWRMSVNLIFFILVVVLLGLFTITGLALIQQAQNLVGVVQRFVTNLPTLVEELSKQVYNIGPLELDMAQYLNPSELRSLLNQLLGIVQPILGQAGGLVSALASTTLSTLGWGIFVILVSYFTLADIGRVPEMFSEIEIPGYNEDIRRLGTRLGQIWNVFLRGQLILFAFSVLTFAIFMAILGLRNALALAILAGFARFVPYVGPFMTWTVTAMVAFLQPSNYLGLEHWQYALLVIGGAVLVDQIFDNLITPRLYGEALGLHPAAVLVAAIIAANLIGIIGLLLAAPVLATLALFSRYTFRKMLDQDPFPEPAPQRTEFNIPGRQALKRVWERIQSRLPSKRSES